MIIKNLYSKIRISYATKREILRTNVDIHKVRIITYCIVTIITTVNTIFP